MITQSVLIPADAAFLEQRRRGLQRYLTALVDHPVTRDDGALNVFLTETSFESWRKRTKVNTDEESLSKRLNPAQEMSIPSDLEHKLSVLRSSLPTLVGAYQKLCVLAERAVGRAMAASADASRMALCLGSVAEIMPRCCYRSGGEEYEVGGAGCSLCRGVGRGVNEIGEAWTRLAEENEKRVSLVRP